MRRSHYHDPQDEKPCLSYYFTSALSTRKFSKDNYLASRLPFWPAPCGGLERESKPLTMMGDTIQWQEELLHGWQVRHYSSSRVPVKLESLSSLSRMWDFCVQRAPGRDGLMVEDPSSSRVWAQETEDLEWLLPLSFAGIFSYSFHWV